MAIPIGINGFGCMGRLGLRSAWGAEGLEFVHVNEIAGDAACSAHLLEFDSVHGTWNRDCSAQDGRLVVDGRGIGYSGNQAAGDTNWSGCDIVIEAAASTRVTKPCAGPLSAASP